jgi:hypothetical protein
MPPGGGDKAGGGDGDGGAGDASPLDCPGVSVTTDGVLDFDVKAVTVSGRVTLDGAAMPDEGGRLVFVHAQHGATASVTLEPDGSYQVTLPGGYEIRWAGVASNCASGQPAPQVPCNAGLIKSAVGLTADGVLDLDVPAVRVSGQVTIDGGAMPAAADPRGSIVFALSGPRREFFWFSSPTAG